MNTSNVPIKISIILLCKENPKEIFSHWQPEAILKENQSSGGCWQELQSFNEKMQSCWMIMFLKFIQSKIIKISLNHVLVAIKICMIKAIRCTSDEDFKRIDRLDQCRSPEEMRYLHILLTSLTNICRLKQSWRIREKLTLHLSLRKGILIDHCAIKRSALHQLSASFLKA